MTPPMPAFLAPFPAHPSSSLRGTPLNTSLCARHRNLVMLADPQSPHSPWDGLRRVIRVSAISASVLMASTLPINRNAQLGTSFFAVPFAAASTQTTSTPNSASDVEAAAMTLGAVTVGGLVMRAIIHSRRDEEADRRRLQAECDKLQEQEQERALRVRRNRMENVDGNDVIPDDQLMSDFMSRVKSIEDDDSDNSETESDDASMRHSPIPDRGLGSAVLDRPDETGDDELSDTETQPENEDEAPELAKPEEAEMLKRMWNLGSSDKE